MGVVGVGGWVVFVWVLLVREVGGMVEYLGVGRGSWGVYFA